MVMRLRGIHSVIPAVRDLEIAVRYLVPVLAGALALGACATTPSGSAADPGAGADPRGGTCSAEAGQRFVGQKAEAATGQAISEATGARVLRWVPPRSAVTMDFREDRVTVSYDDAMVITRVACG
jgi:hypothetical protein